MAALRLGRTGFRLLFIPYALGLSIWLLLGVLPTLAQARQQLPRCERALQ